MNRAQRRKLNKGQRMGTNVPLQPAVPWLPRSVAAEPEQADFSNVPLATMCQSIRLLINELQRRGYPVYDFDNKTKFVQGIQIIQGKVYFLAAEEDSDHEKV